MKREWRRALSAIERDRERGASQLAEEALGILERAWREAPEGRPDATAGAVSDLARALRGARPSMPVLANVVNRAMHAAVSPGIAPLDALRERGAAAAKATRDEARLARGSASRRAASLLRGTVLSHSASGTVTKAIRAAARAGRVERVLLTVSEPGREGVAEARELAADGIEVTLVADAAMGLHAAEASVLLVGADAVLQDGSIVNKVGTLLLGLAGRRHGVPLFAVADSFKIAPLTAIPLEEKDPREILRPLPAGVKARNIYFDRTPADLLAGIVTERDVLAPGEVASHAERCREWTAWESLAARWRFRQK